MKIIRKYKLFFALSFIIVMAVILINKCLENKSPLLKNINTSKDNTSVTNNSDLVNRKSETANQNTSNSAGGSIINSETYELTVLESGWSKLNSENLKLTFEYPLDNEDVISFNTVEYENKNIDPMGQHFEWKNKTKSNFLISWGFSRDHLLGRDEGLSTAYKWIEDGGKYYLVETTPKKNSLGNFEFTDRKVSVEKIKVIDTKFNTQALLYSDDSCGGFAPGFSENCENVKTRNLIVNLPDSHHNKIKAIFVGISENFTEDDIKYIVKSIILL